MQEKQESSHRCHYDENRRGSHGQDWIAYWTNLTIENWHQVDGSQPAHPEKNNSTRKLLTAGVKMKRGSEDQQAHLRYPYGIQKDDIS